MKSLTDYLKEHYTPSTAKSYEREIYIFLSNFPEAKKAVYNQIITYLGIIRSRYSNPKTISRLLASIKVYYNYLDHVGQRKDNPAKNIRLRDKQNRDIQLQDLFTSKELESLLEREERFNKLAYRNKVLMSLLVYQALHPKELSAITLNDINLQQGTIYIKATPKNNSRELSLKPSQIMLFYQYIFEARPRLLRDKQFDLLLIGERGNPITGEDITNHVKRICKNRFEGKNVNAQTIRQSVITNLLKAGNDLRIVQTFAGHKYPGTTERYKQSNVEQLKKAIQIYHPIR